MAGSYRQSDGGDWSAAAESGARADTDAAELIAQIRQLAADADPAGVRQVVADVLSALDRAAGGALREQLPDRLLTATATATATGYAEPPFDPPAGYDNAPANPLTGSDEPPVTRSDPEAAGSDQRSTEAG